MIFDKILAFLGLNQPESQSQIDTKNQRAIVGIISDEKLSCGGDLEPLQAECAASQNGKSMRLTDVFIQDHVTPFLESFVTQPDSKSGNSLIEDRIMDLHNIGELVADMESMHFLNDEVHELYINAQEVIDFGEPLRIELGNIDMVNFVDDGWVLVESSTEETANIPTSEGYETFIHYTGAIVQIDEDVMINTLYLK
jgi:hypothetical protein